MQKYYHLLKSSSVLNNLHENKTGKTNQNLLHKPNYSNVSALMSKVFKVHSKGLCYFDSNVI